jgi:hypothetical protein
VLADGRSSHFERGRDLTGGEFVLSHQFEDRAPAGFGDRPQRFVGLVISPAHRQLTLTLATTDIYRQLSVRE